MAAYRRKFDQSLFKFRKGSGGNLTQPTLRGRGRYEGRQPEGYEYTGKQPFKYKSLTGETRTIQPGERVSSRQYQNLRYQGSGWQSKSEYERISHASATYQGRKRLTRQYGHHEVGAYRKWAQIYGDTHHVDISRPLAPTSDFSVAYNAARKDGFTDLTPDGPFARLLTLIGLRDEEAEWNVGDTP